MKKDFVMNDWELQFEVKITEATKSAGAAHDILHNRRVVNLAKRLCHSEGGDLCVVVPAAWLHDCVYISKDDSKRNQASKISAAHASKWLTEINYDPKKIPGIYHAIEAHSYSANIEATTLEAQIVQDADRLEALGAIGIARCFSVGGMLKRPLYDFSDPESKSRIPNDQLNTLDHFWVKLFKLEGTFKTKAGKSEATIRTQRMRTYIADFLKEIY